MPPPALPVQPAVQHVLPMQPVQAQQPPAPLHAVPPQALVQAGGQAGTLLARMQARQAAGPAAALGQGA
eukprot:14161663-Alexandrium_andersonii.AAC.1